MRRNLAVATLLCAATCATAAPLTWDSSGTSPTSPVDGSGTWDTSTPLWSNGTTDLPWDNSANNTPVFGNGGPAGTVTVDPSGVTAAGLTFHAASGPNPYTLTGGPITLAPGNTTVSTPNSGVVPVILSPLAGSGATGGQGRFVTFSGFITLAAPANSYVGRTTVTNTDVIIGNGANLAYSAPFGAAGNMLTLDSSTLFANGSRTGASVSYQLPYNIKVTGNNTIYTGKSFTLGALSPTPYTVQGAGSLTFNNNLSATTSNISASFSGAGTDAFTGTLHLTSIGANTINLYPTTFGNFLGVPNGTLDVNAAVSPQTFGGPFTFSLGALTGSGSLGGGFTPATLATYSVGSLGLSTSFSGTLSGNAALTLTGGSLTLSTPPFHPNTYTGSTTLSAGTLVLAGSNLTSTSSISVASAATLRLQPGSAVNTSTLTLSPGSTLDLTSNTLTFDTTIPGHDAPTLLASLASAYNHGTWTGPGITSSTLAPTQSLAYTLTPTSLTIKTTYTGDATLDGKIDGDDYTLLDRSLAQHLSNAHWTDGDFNYDGQVDTSDYLLVDATLGQAQGFSPDFLAQRQSQFGAQYVQALITSIPEPTSPLLLLATGYWLLATPRPRRAHP